MLLHAAIGDSFGAGFEYVKPEIVKEFAHKLEYRAHPKHLKIQPGCYTDDSQSALAICEAMIENDLWTAKSLSKRFVDVFKRDERTGYSGKFYGVLMKVKDGNELLQTVDGTSDRSGGAMRAFPVGLFSQTPEVINRSCIQASITHCSPLGISAAVASALMTHYFCYRKGVKHDLGYFLDEWTPKYKEIGSWNEKYEGKVGAKGWMSVKAAVTAIKESNSITELLVKCIEFTGDVDTVATIALAAASFCDEIDQNLPQSLIDGLENGTYGRDYIIKLDEQLMTRVRRPEK